MRDELRTRRGRWLSQGTVWLPPFPKLHLPCRHTHTRTHTLALLTHFTLDWVAVTRFAQLLRSYFVTGFRASWDIQLGGAEASLLWQQGRNPQNSSLKHSRKRCNCIMEQTQFGCLFPLSALLVVSVGVIQNSNRSAVIHLCSCQQS